MGYRYAVACGLCKLDAVPDDGTEVPAAEVIVDFIDDRLDKG